jgi:hypothetical protein
LVVFADRKRTPPQAHACALASFGRMDVVDQDPDEQPQPVAAFDDGLLVQHCAPRIAQPHDYFPHGIERLQASLTQTVEQGGRPAHATHARDHACLQHSRNSVNAEMPMEVRVAEPRHGFRRVRAFARSHGKASRQHRHGA